MAAHSPAPFDEAHAAVYDKNFEKLASFKDALHVLIRAALLDLPSDARLLCVGAGTGAELLYLAKAFPTWTFTAVDTSAPMLDVCRRRIDEAGFSDRCAYHHGAIASLAASEPFDAATSLLVSQFVLDEQQRRAFFADIALRLRQDGRLIAADLACDMNAPASAGALEIWRRTMQYNGADEEQLNRMFEAYNKAVSVIPETDIKTLMVSAGFEEPTRFFQTGLIHGWYARLRA